MTLLFCDIETTGLVPEDDNIIEVGLAQVSDNLEIIHEVSHVVHLSGIDTWQDFEPPFGIQKVVVDMHRKSGLWKESHESKLSLRAVENELTKWMFEHNLQDLPLVGNTIGFDRSFLRVHMGRLNDMFHYRSLDISSIKIADQLWNRTEDKEPHGQKMHRVIPDIHDSLEELRYFHGKYFSNSSRDRSGYRHRMVTEPE